MKSARVRTRNRLPYQRIASLVCWLFTALPAAAFLLSNDSLAFPKLAWRQGNIARLKTKRDDDFASFNDFGTEEDVDVEGEGLVRDFYQELELRAQSPLKYNPGGKNKQNMDGNKNTAKTLKIIVNGNGNRPPPTSSSSKEPPPSASLSIFRFFSSPAPPTASAGLFSGSGTTVYSSGRSIRAEIEILETTLKNNDAKDNKKQETEELCRTVAISFIIMLSAGYFVSEASTSGGTTLILGDGASADHVMSLVDGMFGIMVNVGYDDVFLGEEAAWLVRESSGLAAFVVETVRSVEELVPR